MSAHLRVKTPQAWARCGQLLRAPAAGGARRTRAPTVLTPASPCICVQGDGVTVSRAWGARLRRASSPHHGEQMGQGAPKSSPGLSFRCVFTAGPAGHRVGQHYYPRVSAVCGLSQDPGWRRGSESLRGRQDNPAPLASGAPHPQRLLGGGQDGGSIHPLAEDGGPTLPVSSPTALSPACRNWMRC